jgi:hypothetical protein
MSQVLGREYLLFRILLLVISFILQIQLLHIQHLPLCKRLATIACKGSKSDRIPEDFFLSQWDLQTLPGPQAN